MHVRGPRRLSQSPVAWLSACALVGGCATSHKLVSARHTPCKYSEIEISQESYAAEEETWVATCGDRTYDCATQAIGNRVQYRCRPREQSSLHQK